MNMEKARASHKEAFDAYSEHLFGEYAAAGMAMDQSIVFRPALLERLKLAEARLGELYTAEQRALRVLCDVRDGRVAV
jgi:hypothetical protein